MKNDHLFMCIIRLINKYCQLLFLLLLFLPAGRISAQYFYFDKIPSQEGDVDLSVRQVLQDEQGFIWLATFDGLYRFDSDGFIVKHQFLGGEEINHDVTCLLKDRNNNIWIGTNDGLYKYKPETEELTIFKQNKDLPNSISTNKIRSLAIDKSGRIWVGTYSKGLFLFDPNLESFIHIDFENYIQKVPAYIRTIFIDDDGKIWFGTLENGLYCFKYKDESIDSVLNFREETDSMKISDNYVYEILKDKDGTILVGSQNGLNVFNPVSEKFTDISSDVFLPGSMTNLFRSVIREKNGKLWLGSWGGVVLCDSISDLKSGNFQILKHDRSNPHSISHNQIMDIFQDKSGIILIATENDFCRYDPYLNLFQPLTGNEINQLKEQTATAFSPSKNGLLMLSLSGEVLAEQENQFKSVYFKPLPQFQDEKFYSLCADSKQNLWIGSNSGLLVKYDTKTKVVSKYYHSKDIIPIYSIAELDNNIIAIGTFGEGLKYFNPITGKFRAEPSLSANIEINDIFTDSKKQLWIATQFGIFKRENEKRSFEYYLPDHVDSVLTPNHFFDIEESADGKIYVGGRNGLYVYNESTNTFNKKDFNMQERLWVTNLQFDSKQNLWMNLYHNNVAKWDMSNGQIQIFNVNNGVRVSPYNMRGFFIDKNDRLLISGFDNIFEFNAASILKNNYSPKPVFTKLQINNIEIRPGLELNNQQILHKNISCEKEFELNHLNKDFTISFSSASYVNAKENRFRYILHGYDKQWHTGKEHSAVYTNLHPGRYSFEVFGANNDGVWSHESARIDIRILPAPLVSKMAFFVYFLTFLIVAYFVRRFIVARIQLRNELLIEKVKRDKEEKFHQERVRFYTNISHELRTPLTLIMGPVKDLLTKDKPNTESSRLHQLIANNSQRLLSLVNQLLDFRKSIQQSMKLKVTESNMVDIIKSNIEAFDYMIKEKKIHIDFQTHNPLINGWFDIEKVDIILFNILSNAFKYTPESGFIDVDVKTSAANSNLNTQHIEIRITNSGKGIPKHLQEKVFERFYQVEDQLNKMKYNTGTGIGLSFVKDLVELHHGNITLNSELGKSTTFTICLPKNKQDYSNEEIFDFMRDANRRTKELIKKFESKSEESIFDKKDTRGEKILVVEDNPELRDYLVGFLSSIYVVYTAKDGVEGLEQCKEKNPDLVLSDVMMDNKDGFSFCKELKTTPEISHIPVILMTALANIENMMEGYKTGADDYITKPFEPELLKLRIRNILENRSKIKIDFAHNDKVTAKELTISKIDEDFLNKVIDLVDKNLDNAYFDIDSFSKHLGVSSSQLYRKIKGITGISPNEFIRAYRLREAAKMISETNLTMSEIAYNVGFNDSRYFSKCFKKQFGVVPTKYLN